MEFVKSASEIWGETNKVGKVVMVVVIAAVIVVGVVGMCYAITHPYMQTQA